MTTVAQDAMLPTYRRWPVEFVSGSGARLTDTDGRTFIDLMAGIAVASVGHGNPRIADAIAKQATKLVHVSNLYVTAPQRALAERLAALTGGMQAFFCNSGTEAIECAIKIARKALRSRTGTDGLIVAAHGGFHGRTLGALAATGQPTKQEPFEPLPRGFLHVPYGDSEALEHAINDEVAAVLLEPIQGEAGVIVPPRGYLTRARELCDRHGALLILDEVQTGVGRTGTFLAAEEEEIAADIVCLAKGLAGGLPIGACLARGVAAETLVPGDHGCTFGGGPVPCVAALTVLDILEEGALENVVSVGAHLQEGLASIVGAVRGRGLLLAFDVDPGKARDFAAAALDAGVLVNDATTSTIRICPPLVITEDDVDDALVRLANAWGGLL